MIEKPFMPVVDQAAVKRNPDHWPAQVEGFLACGYGGEASRKEEERKHSPDGSEHAPPAFCYKLAEAWCLKMDEFISAYFLMPKGSFRDSALDRRKKA